MKLNPIPFILSALVFISACSENKVEQHPPHELTTYPEEISFRKSGSIDVGSGDGDTYLQFQPALWTEGDDVYIYTTDYNGRVTATLWDDNVSRLWRESPDDVSVTGGAGVGSGLVLIGTQKGLVVALSQSNGEELWRTYLSSDILSAPQSADGIVAVLTEDSRVYGLDAKTGKVIWNYQHTAPLLQLRGSAPVIIDDKVVYVGFANGFVSALDLPTGRVLWQQAVSYPRGRSEIDRIVDVNGRMAIDDNVLYAVNYQGRVIAIDTTQQGLIWEKSLSSYSGLDVGDEAVFITDQDSVVWALDRKTGETLWRQEDLSYRDLTAPTSFHNMVAVGDFAGYVHLLAADNGQFLGRIQVDSDPIHTPPVAEKNHLFVLTSDGELIRLTPEPTS